MDAVAGIFEQDALAGEVVADGVSLLEVAAFAGVVAGSNLEVDFFVGELIGVTEMFGGLLLDSFELGPGEGSAGDVGVAIGEHVENGVEAGEEGKNLCGVVGLQGALVGGRVGSADEIKDGGAGFGGVEVVAESIVEGLVGGGGVGVESGIASRWEGSVGETAMERAEALDGTGGFDETAESEVELMAIRDGGKQEANGGGFVTLQEQIAKGEEIAFGFRHLAAFDEEEADVHPVAGEGLAGGGFRLRDFVFVMGEHEVFAAEVEVEAVAEKFARHSRALDMPAGATGTDGRLPEIFVGLGSFPEGEVAGAVFVVFVEVYAGAVFHAGEVAFGELAVAGESGDAEVPGAIFGAIGEAFVGEGLDHGDHLGNVFGGTDHVLGALDGEEVHVLKKCLGEFRSVFGDGEAGGSRVADDLVVDVGDVHDVIEGEAFHEERATENVHVNEGAEVANVAVVIHGRAAGVDADALAVFGEELFLLAGEGVEEADGHEGNVVAERLFRFYSASEGWAVSEGSARRCATNFGQAAAAIMAALSVLRPGVGK
jgi:hypothetical protein